MVGFCYLQMKGKPVNGEVTRDMDDAWREYLAKRDEKSAELKFGWNPKHCFVSGYLAGQATVNRNDGDVRSSGWSNYGK